MPDPALRDAAGTVHVPAPRDARIVSLVPSITELLFDLGAGDRVVGRTPFCIHPRGGVANVPRVGGTKTPRLDRIRALEPTHLIVNVDENRREDADALAAFVPNVIVTHPLGPRDNPALYRLVGGIFASGEATDRLCRAFERAVSALESAAHGFPERQILYLIWRNPWMTVTRDTYVSRTLALVNLFTAGGGTAGGATRSLLSPRSFSVASTWCCFRASRFRSRSATPRRSARSPGRDAPASSCSTARWRHGTGRARSGPWITSCASRRGSGTSTESREHSPGSAVPGT